MCVTYYENDSDCFLAASSHLPAPEEVKARRVPRRTTYGRPVRASSPSRLGRVCGVSCCATKHNGLFGKVAAVTTLAHRLVRLPLRTRPLRPSGLPNPRYVLRPLPCACGLLLTACSNKPHAEAAIGVCGHGWGRHHRGSGQALRAASRVVGPPTPGRLLRPASALRASRPVLTDRPSLKSNSRAANSRRPTACTALRAVPPLWRTTSAHHTSPLDWRGCSSGARQ